MRPRKSLPYNNARGGSRTRTGFLPRDFKDEEQWCPTAPIANHAPDLQASSRTIATLRRCDFARSSRR